MKRKRNSVKFILVLLICSAMFSTLMGCSSTKKVDNSNTDSKHISIKYLGNSCFIITFIDGTRLVSDPYITDWSTKYGSFNKMDIDVMTISHTHGDHTGGVSYFTGDPVVLHPEDTNETVTVGDVKITGYQTKHVANMGNNSVFVYEENGLKIVHMGETDNLDSKEVQDAVKDADVILAYAGEYGEVKNKDSFNTLTKDLNIKVLIPQHYSLNADALTYNQPAMKTIISELPKGLKVTKTNEFFVTKDLKKQFVKMSINNLK